MLVIRIAAIILASDSAITLARFRPSKFPKVILGAEKPPEMWRDLEYFLCLEVSQLSPVFFFYGDFLAKLHRKLERKDKNPLEKIQRATETIEMCPESHLLSSPKNGPINSTTFFLLDDNQKNKDFFIPTEPLKSLEKKGKNTQKNKEFQATRRSPKTRKGQGVIALPK